MSSLAVLANGSELHLGDGGDPTEVFAKIPEVVELDEIVFETELVDTTPIDTDTKCYIQGMKDGSEFNIVMNRIAADTQQNALEAAVGTSKNFEFRLNNGEIGSFSALIRNFNRTAVAGEQIKLTVPCKLNSAITWT